MKYHTIDRPSSGFSLLHDHLSGLMAKTLANAYMKDTSGRYLAANASQVERSGMHTHHALIGATDHDLVWKACADILIKHDQHVILKREATIFIEPVNLNRSVDASQDHSYLSYKSPLLDANGGVIGVYGFSYLLDESLSINQIFDELALIIGKHGIHYAKMLISRHRLVSSSLTTRQLDCLKLLAKGMTMKQIGVSLGLSSRTVEHYLEAVKSKLKCGTRAEMIGVALELGFE